MDSLESGRCEGHGIYRDLSLYESKTERGKKRVGDGVHRVRVRWEEKTCTVYWCDWIDSH